MLGLHRLFGVDPRNLHTTAQTYDFWRGLGVWEGPKVMGFTKFHFRARRPCA